MTGATKGVLKMRENKVPNIPQSVIDNLARATLKAMREERDRKTGADAQGAPSSPSERRGKCQSS